MERLGKISVRGIYGQSKLCRWLFIHSNSTSSNIIVNFHFTYFDVPCRHGYVTLHDRHGGKRKTYCGASPPIVPSLPASSQIALEIQLENSSDVWGFELKYRTESIGTTKALTFPSFYHIKIHFFFINHLFLWLLSFTHEA